MSTVRIHYYRPDDNYSGWALYAWNASTEKVSWCSDELQTTGTDSFGIYFDVAVDLTKGMPPGDLGFVINNCSAGQIKDPGPDQHLQTTKYNEAWVVHGNSTVFTTEPTPQQVYWMDRTRVAVPAQYILDGATGGGVYAISGGPEIPLGSGGPLTQEQLARYPQLASYAVLQIPATVPLDTIKQALKGELVFTASGASGALTYTTGIQIAPVLDDLFYYPGQLGVVFTTSGEIQINVWAPTAQAITLLLFDAQIDTIPAVSVAMREDNGVWTAQIAADWNSKYYLFSVTVWVPSAGAVVTNLATDPYSVDLALNGTKSRITDLGSQQTKPAGWDASGPSVPASFSDLSIYELHIRDFSVNDSTVPVEHRGMYAAFGDANSSGMQHLSALAEIGLKAIHLLPSFHFSSVEEDKFTWKTTGDLSPYAPDSEEQQAAVTAIQEVDAYNWGYDPVHYMAPEGSYAINPDNRVIEYRGMVQTLHAAGLRVIQDVVFNHTSGSRPDSNLDQIVPGYYHRLDANGALLNASCCPDTASEHRMMEKLMIDTLVLNAREYKIDGFRFDIMSFHFTYNMTNIQNALNAQGLQVYLYGEGFNFGDTVNGQIGPNAEQLSLYGYGIGTFNDRMRDGIRGGNPFADQRLQGFATGLFTDLQYADWIRVGLTGNLRDYTFTDYTGATVTGAQVIYDGQPTGYAATPIETINYCSVHDNQDLFDAVQLKSPSGDSIATRARRQILAMSLIALGQGIPFFHAGDDLLRSKGMDQNSYNSGDWFNKIDWSGQTNNWGIGLPIASQNEAQWPLMRPLLSNPVYTPQPAHIGYASAAFRELLQIRYSSGLFRMSTFEEVQQNLSFLNTGSNQTPGLIVIKLDGNGEHIVVLFNATTSQMTFTDARLEGLGLQLHPVQQLSRDPVTRQSVFSDQKGSATIQPLTTAVFVSSGF